MKNKAAQELGKLGGDKTLHKYGREQLRNWGKLGGRPKIYSKCPKCGNRVLGETDGFCGDCI